MEKELEEARAEIEKLRAACDEKLKIRDEENAYLLLSLDEVIVRDREKQLMLDALADQADEWEEEKSSLLDEISSLEQYIHDGNEAIEGLQNQLNLCKQALDNEQKCSQKPEVQIPELKLSLPNEGEQQVPESSTAERDVKEIEFKDMKHRVNTLEKENNELLVSIKELHEAQTEKVAIPHLMKVHSNLEALEQTHRECTNNFKAMEVKWTCQAQKMTLELNWCSSSLRAKDQVIQELKKDQDDNIAQLMEQLTLKNISLARAQNELRKEKEEKVVIQRELERCTEMLEESSDGQLELMEQIAETERKLTEELQEAYDSLEMLESELADKTAESTELEFELQSWQSVTDRLKTQFDETLKTRRVLERSLIAQAEVEEMLRREIEDKDRKIRNLEQQIFLFDQEIRIEEEEECVSVKIKVPQQLQSDGNEHMQKEPKKTTRAHKEADNTREIADCQENVIENLQNSGAMRKQSSQEAKVTSNPSSQEIRGLQNPPKSKLNIEPCGESSQEDYATNKQSSYQVNQWSEKANSQSTENAKDVECPQHNKVVAGEQSSQQVNQESKTKSKAGSQNKQQPSMGSQHVESTQKAEVGRKTLQHMENNDTEKQHSHQVNNESVDQDSNTKPKVGSQNNQQPDMSSQHVESTQKAEVGKTKMQHMENNNAEKQSSNQVNDKSKHHSGQVTNAQKTELANKKNSQKVNDESKHHSGHVTNAQKTEVASKHSSQKVKDESKDHSRHAPDAQKTEVAAKQSSEKVKDESKDHSGHVTDAQKTEVTTKQSLAKVKDGSKDHSGHVTDAQKTEVTTKQSSEKVKDGSKDHSEHVTNAQKIEHATKPSSQHIDVPLQVNVTSNPSPQRVSKKFEVTSKSSPQQICKMFETAGKQSSLQSKTDMQAQQETKRTVGKLGGKIGKMIQGFESGKKRIEVEGEICVTEDDKNKRNSIVTKTM